MSLAVASVLNENLASHLDDGPLASIAEQIHARAVAAFMVRETEIEPEARQWSPLISGLAWVAGLHEYDLAGRPAVEVGPLRVFFQDRLHLGARPYVPEHVGGLAVVFVSLAAQDQRGLAGDSRTA
jgi:hypothetical protein